MSESENHVDPDGAEPVDAEPLDSVEAMWWATMRAMWSRSPLTAHGENLQRLAEIYGVERRKPAERCAVVGDEIAATRVVDVV